MIFRFVGAKLWHFRHTSSRKNIMTLCFCCTAYLQTFQKPAIFVSYTVIFQKRTSSRRPFSVSTITNYYKTYKTNQLLLYMMEVLFIIASASHPDRDSSYAYRPD